MDSFGRTGRTIIEKINLNLSPSPVRNFRTVRTGLSDFNIFEMFHLYTKCFYKILLIIALFGIVEEESVWGFSVDRAELFILPLYVKIHSDSEDHPWSSSTFDATFLIFSSLIMKWCILIEILSLYSRKCSIITWQYSIV